MKSFIIPIIILFIAIYGLGEFRISISPFKIYLERPYQLVGVLMIAIGTFLIKEQGERDTKKAIIEQLQEELESLSTNAIVQTQCVASPESNSSPEGIAKETTI
jgi:hypothetical protein